MKKMKLVLNPKYDGKYLTTGVGYDFVQGKPIHADIDNPIIQHYINQGNLLFVETDELKKYKTEAEQRIKEQEEKQKMLYAKQAKEQTAPKNDLKKEEKKEEKEDNSEADMSKLMKDDVEESTLKEVVTEENAKEMKKAKKKKKKEE